MVQRMLACLIFLVALSPAAAPSQSISPQDSKAPPTCPVTHAKLAEALKKSVKPSGGPVNGGYENNEWAVVVSRDGSICAIAYSGSAATEQWPGSRAVAAEKAFTANAFSLKAHAMSTANLYAGAQPGGPLFGINASAPPVTSLFEDGDASQFGTDSDPVVGKRAGGIIVFGGGLALYNESDVVGALGVSGDSSCADHNVAWRVRQALNLNHAPAGVGSNKTDGIIYDVGITGASRSGFGHPKCAGSEPKIASDIGASISEGLFQ
jgi:uncharacterized protein GlcG (DUF336 family)